MPHHLSSWKRGAKSLCQAADAEDVQSSGQKLLVPRYSRIGSPPSSASKDLACGAVSGDPAISTIFKEATVTNDMLENRQTGASKKNDRSRKLGRMFPSNGLSNGSHLPSSRLDVEAIHSWHEALLQQYSVAICTKRGSKLALCEWWVRIQGIEVAVVQPAH